MGDRSGEVADALWQRVRDQAEQIAALERLERLDGLDEQGRAQLALARLRCTRAAARAGLADNLADRLADLGRGAGGRPGAPEGFYERK